MLTKEQYELYLLHQSKTKRLEPVKEPTCRACTNYDRPGWIFYNCAWVKCPNCN